MPLPLDPRLHGEKKSTSLSLSRPLLEALRRAAEEDGFDNLSLYVSAMLVDSLDRRMPAKAERKRGP